MSAVKAHAILPPPPPKNLIKFSKLPPPLHNSVPNTDYRLVWRSGSFTASL